MFKAKKKLDWKITYILIFFFFLSSLARSEEKTYLKIPLVHEDAAEDSQKSLNDVPHYLSFGFGPAKFFNFGTEREDNSAYHFQVRYDYDFKNEFSALLKANGAFDEAGSFMTGGSIGARFCLGSEDIAAFVGGDLGLGFVASGNKAYAEQEPFQDKTDLYKRRFGFHYGGSVGVQFFRGSTVHCELGVNFTRAAKRLNIKEDYPAVASLNISLSSKNLT